MGATENLLDSVEPVFVGYVADLCTILLYVF
jgi:hypothetical protein